MKAVEFVTSKGAPNPDVEKVLVSNKGKDLVRGIL
jgi:hypothetical protein